MIPAGVGFEYDSEIPDYEPDATLDNGTVPSELIAPQTPAYPCPHASPLHMPADNCLGDNLQRSEESDALRRALEQLNIGE